MGKTPEHAEFAKWLADRMATARINNSDLARMIWGTTTDNRGYKVARNRDRIGQYLSGASYPNLNTLYELGTVFSVFPDDIPGRPGKRVGVPDDTLTDINRKLDRILGILASSMKPPAQKRRNPSL